ncbi:acyltransferase family protein [Dyadobacter aurulentus]|uniref:acyltransferase family protein n=1 Tax=Dyadobacter sp. UC 10 TaxID=2605428 RepID=UPI0011F10BA2|nr:acyltransferase [Dyadobacter sp. UC 10]KAA0990830.1 acyltransferase [Dyadobacter sp. UC 10]
MYTYPIKEPQGIAERHQELDALRGLAAISIVLFHFTINNNAKLLGWQFNYGVTAVDIFFMISGFVIFQSIRNITKWQDFVVKRFARLYPAFWYCMLITAFVAVLMEPHSVDATRILANATMASIYFGVEDLDGSYWTLLIELVFYTWILAIFVSNRVNAIEQIGVCCILLIVAFHAMRPLYHDLYQFLTRKVQLLNHFPLFYSGILFYQIKRSRHVYRNSALLIPAILASFYLHDKGGTSQYHISFVEHCVVITIFHIIFVLFIIGKLGFLVAKPLLMLGNISYCLYLIHQYVGLQIIAKLTGDLGINVYFAIIFTISVCICIATLITTYIEIPCYQLIRNWYSRSSSIFRQQDNDLAIH